MNISANNLFYSSMSNVLNQWSDFRVSRNMYRAYFDLQKTQTEQSSSADSYLQQLVNSKTTVNKTEDKLGELSENLTSSASKLKTGFAPDEKTGELDLEAVYKSVSDFVGSYNSFMSAISKSGDSTVQSKYQFMTNMTTAYSRQLTKAGISINTDGTLSLNKDTFNKASATELTDVFTDSKSFASFMSKQAEQLNAYSQSDSYNKASTTYSVTGSLTQSAGLNGSLLNLFA